MTDSFLLKAGHAVLGERNFGRWIVSLKAYVYMATSYVVFSICYSSGVQG